MNTEVQWVFWCLWANMHQSNTARFLPRLSSSCHAFKYTTMLASTRRQAPYCSRPLGPGLLAGKGGGVDATALLWNPATETAGGRANGLCRRDGEGAKATNGVGVLRGAVHRDARSKMLKPGDTTESRSPLALENPKYMQTSSRPCACGRARLSRWSGQTDCGWKRGTDVHMSTRTESGSGSVSRSSSWKAACPASQQLNLLPCLPAARQPGQHKPHPPWSLEIPVVAKEDQGRGRAEKKKEQKMVPTPGSSPPPVARSLFARWHHHPQPGHGRGPLCLEGWATRPC